MPIAGSIAFSPDVTALGDVHVRPPSDDVDTTTPFCEQPALNRQSCQVAQTRPDGSMSAEGSGKRRRPGMVRVWMSATTVGAPNDAPPSADTVAPIRLPSHRKTATIPPSGRITGNTPTVSFTGILTGADHVTPPSLDVSDARLSPRSVSVYMR